MEYTVQSLGRLAGVSARTLRYYDEIGILRPARINSSGYRIYGQREIDRLQHILFYRELGVSLDTIREVMLSTSFDSLTALKDHRQKLLEKQLQIEKLISNVDKTITAAERSLVMSDQEKFEGFKKKMLDENEKKYGDEVRRKYGSEAVERSNSKFMNMSQNDYNQADELATKILETLSEAMETGDPSGEKAQMAADLHKKWLTLYWDKYSPEAHAAIGDMYVYDERFRAYYDKVRPGMAEFLRDAIKIYTGA